MSIFSVTNDALTIGVTYPVSLPFKTKQVMGLFFLLQTPCPRLVYARAQASLVFARKGRLRRGKEDLLFCRHPAMPLYVALPMRATTDSWQTTDSATTASYKSWFFFLFKSPHLPIHVLTEWLPSCGCFFPITGSNQRSLTLTTTIFESLTRLQN